MKKIGYLGPRGTFSHEAIKKYISGETACDTPNYNNITDLILAVHNGEIDEAIVPIENSIEGAVNATLDVFTEVDLKIKDEIVIAIKENLMVKKGTNFKDIEYILSHPQPIGQCRKYISSNFPKASIKYTHSTAYAAEEVAAGNGNMAAIGPAAAAEVYGLEVLEENIQDEDNNHTRFVIVSKSDNERTGVDKTSIVFSTDNKPGSLYRVLDIFNLWDINMTRIESRPAKDQLGRYIFFIDIDGHRDDEDVDSALTMVKRKTSYYRFLGSYPRHEF